MDPPRLGPAAPEQTGSSGAGSRPPSQTHTPRLWLLFQGWAQQRETKGPGPGTLSQCSSHLGENRSLGGRAEGAAVSRYRRGRGGPEEALAGEGERECSRAPRKRNLSSRPGPLPSHSTTGPHSGWPARFKPQLGFKPIAGVQVDSCQPLITFSITNQSLTWFSTCLKTPYLMDGVDSEC